MNSELTVVLLPGLDGTGRLFQRFVERTPAQYRTEVVSYPGDLELDYAQLESRVRTELPPSAPYIIVGESFSGPLAVVLAARPTGALRGIVMVASFVTPPAHGLWKYLPWRLVFRFPLPAQILRQVLAPADTELAKDMRAIARSVSPRVLASRVRLTLAVDMRAELAKSTVPVLYLQAMRDLVVPARCLRAIMSLRSDVIVARLAKAHPILQLEPDGAWRAIEAFARRMPTNNVLQLSASSRGCPLPRVRRTLAGRRSSEVVSSWRAIPMVFPDWSSPGVSAHACRLPHSQRPVDFPARS